MPQKILENMDNKKGIAEKIRSKIQSLPQWSHPLVGLFIAGLAIFFFPIILLLILGASTWEIGGLIWGMTFGEEE